MKIEIDVDPKTWWRIAENAEARGLRASELIRREVLQRFDPYVSSQSFEASLLALHSRGLDDGAICVELGVTRQRVATVRRRLGLPPNQRHLLAGAPS